VHWLGSSAKTKSTDVLIVLSSLHGKRDARLCHELGETQGEIKKKSAKKYISIKAGGGVKLTKPSILVVN